MDSNVAVLKLKSNKSELAKKNAVFWTTFFFIDPLVYLHLRLLG